MSNKRNDSFPQKNVSLNVTQLPREPQVRSSAELSGGLEGEQAESSPSIFFNKTSLIGVGVLVLALISVALPYSLGWLSVADSGAEIQEPSGTDPDEATEEENFDSFPMLPSSQTSGDLFSDLTVDDPNSQNLYGPTNSASFDLLDPPDEYPPSQEWYEGEQAIAFTEPETVEGFLDIPDSDFGGSLLTQYQSEQISVQQPQPQPQPSPKLTVPPRNEPVVTQAALEVSDDGDWGRDLASPHSPLSTSHSTSIQPLVDHSAINASPSDQAAVRVVNYDRRPDTVCPMDEDDHRTLESGTNFYAAQSPLDTEASLSESLSESPQNTARLAAVRKEYRPKYAQVREGSRSLPNADGQLWCPYDITPFTRVAAAASGTRPEQTLVKWIRRQTGEEFWHSEPFGILSATSETLYVYHTPEVQEMVAEIVDRFVNPQGEADAYMFRVVSLNGPSWLTQFHTNLKPIRIDTPGAQGWLLAKEDYVKMIPELARRSDYKELCSPQFPIRNGREYVVSASVPKTYTSNVSPKDNVWPGYAAETAVINEGYSMSLIPLSGVDGASADLMIKCESIQVEKMHTVALNVPSQVTSRQRVTIESPQVSHFQLDEQIRWPKSKVLVLSLGTIPVPSAAQHNNAGKLIPELSRTLSGSPAARGHVLLFVECASIR